MDPDTAKLVAAITGLASLLGAVVGATITSTANYFAARAGRTAQLDLDRQKARRERRAARVTPFLDRVHTRLHDFAGVVATSRAGSPEQFEAAMLHVGQTTEELVANSSVMPAASGEPGTLGAALVNFMRADEAARHAVMAIRKEAHVGKESVTVEPSLIDALVTAHSELSSAIAALDDAVDDYIDGRPKAR